MRARLPRSRRDFGRIALVAFAIVVACELIYVLAATLLLRAGLLERLLNTDPDAFEVRIGGGYSVIPGRVVVEDFSLRNQDSNVQFLLEVPRATVSIELFELIGRRFHLTRVEAEGTRFRARNRVQRSQLADPRLAAYPPIPGLSDPPLAPLKVPHKRLGSRPFTIELDNVHTTASEIWVLEYRYFGPAVAMGSFRLIPTERVWVGPASLELGSGTVSTGIGDTVANKVRSSVSVTMPDFDVREVHGLHVFEHMLASGTLEAELENLRFTRVYFEGRRASPLSGGAGSIQAKLAVERGHVTAGSHLAYGTRELAFENERLRVAGDAALELRVTRSRNVDLGSLVLAAERVRVFGKAERVAPVPAEIADVKLTMATAQPGIGQSWRMAGGELRIPQITVRDLRLINALGVPKHAVLAEAGAAAFAVTARVTEGGALDAALDAKLQRARLGIAGKTSIDVTGSASAELHQPAANELTGRITKLTAEARPAYLWTDSGATGGGWLRVEDGRVEYEHGALKLARATVRARFKDAKRVLEAVGVRLGTLPKLASSVVDLENLRVTLDVAHTPKLTDVRLREGRTDGMSGSGRWLKDGKNTRGAFLLVFSVTKFGVKLQNSESEVSPFVGSDWLPKELAALGIDARIR